MSSSQVQNRKAKKDEKNKPQTLFSTLSIPQSQFHGHDCKQDEEEPNQLDVQQQQPTQL